MKTTNLFLLFFALVITHSSLAVDDRYQETMNKNIQIVYTGKTIAELQPAVNTFERIGAAEKTKWEPFYYAAFGYSMMSTQETDNAKKDAYLDQAMTAVNQAKGIAPNESEVVALEGFVYMLRVSIDPATRGAQYAPLSMKIFETAIALNPENPRALAMKAQMQFGTAQFFGSPTTDACATNAKALEKFGTYRSDNPLAPVWGKSMADGLVERCK